MENIILSKRLTIFKNKNVSKLHPNWTEQIRWTMYRQITSEYKNRNHMIIFSKKINTICLPVPWTGEL